MPDRDPPAGALTGQTLQHLARSAAAGLPGVTRGRPFVDKLDVHKVAGKVFLIVTDDPDERIITVKSEPEQARALRHSYPSITAGRYLNKDHWISVGAGRGITAEFVEDCVTGSYDLVLDTVPHRRRPRWANP
ncbi:MmcQ/YjbR family DNA-binding protein [Saccharopolyspora sp. CA-218241]|uniref:MmcQ/YjbR family DNA-binding protein n=1 Tax=Saccharopolyspora sp. CA-218241 TaxID=3240027 RepID=UPI003D95E4FC